MTRSSKRELLVTLEKFQGMPALVVGDIMLDRYIWGKVERISAEAPVPIVEVTKVEDRLGGAGNVVENLLCVGAKVSLCGFVGDDEEGKIVLSLLDKEGVEKSGVISDRSRPTTLKTRVIASKQQVLRIDREQRGDHALALKEGFAAAVDAQFELNKTVIISDYGKGAISDSLIKKLSKGLSEKKLSLKARPLVVDPHPSNYNIYSGMNVAKPNRKEAEIASGVKIQTKQDAVKAAKVLLDKWKAEIMVITLGEGGLVIVTPEQPEGIFLDTVAREIFDVSGAGDTVTAVFSMALACGASPALAGDLANIAAGIVVSEVGTVPVRLDQLRAEVERLGK